jgi:transcriptional regulator with XRE-family HTH domain
MTRVIQEVARRAEAAKAAVLASPRAPRSLIAQRLGISRGQLAYYLSGKLKAYTSPYWARTFYACAAALAFDQLPQAVRELRVLAMEIENHERWAREPEKK